MCNTDISRSLVKVKQNQTLNTGEDWDESCKPKVAKLVHTLYDKYHPNQPKKKGSLQRMFSGNVG